MGTGGWRPAPQDEEAAEAPDASEPEGPPPLEVELVLVATASAASPILELTEARKPDTLVLVQSQAASGSQEEGKVRQSLFLDAPCEVLWLRPGATRPDANGRIVATAARGPHGKLSLALAHELSEPHEGAEVTALYVEQNVGALSRDVGRHVLDGLVQRALGARASEVQRAVVVDDQVHDGIVEHLKRTEPELLVLGASKRSALGRRLMRTAGLKVLQANADQTAIIARASLPLAGRMRRRIEAFLQRTVPQLERKERVDLVERVQSNSFWDFDFVALMSLSTLIAGLGLMADSAAVIIGAMLVAPLMTPLLGIGLALVQGNPNLIRASLRTVSLGFATAYVLGFLLGLLDPTFDAATPEMLSRCSPGPRDLLVAFVSGLAGAYASSRSTLLAALPGVAIAAALVPPIATAGLATALFEGGVDGGAGLIGGALLLFLTNAVLIVFAATLSLAAVGVRFEPGSSRTSQATGAFLILAALALTVGLWIQAPAPIERLRIQDALPENFQVLDARWVKDREGGAPILAVRVAGPGAPPADLAQTLRRRLSKPKDEEGPPQKGPQKVRIEAVLELVSTRGEKVDDGR
ncbi:MAG: DUF389 domain-containing protein [bacterium]|nr:DUF389 domain-containing protein [bacterium]